MTSLNETVPAKDERLLDLPAGSRAIHRLELRLEPSTREERERALRSLVIELRFNNSTTVWCPATDFFGSGVGLNEVRSWYRAVSQDGMMSCR